MALSCGFCGSEIKGGYRGCSACGAVLRRPPLVTMLLRFILVLVAVSVVGQLGRAAEKAISPYSEVLGNIVGTVFVVLAPVAAIWFLVKQSICTALVQTTRLSLTKIGKVTSQF